VCFVCWAPPAPAAVLSDAEFIERLSSNGISHCVVILYANKAGILFAAMAMMLMRFPARRPPAVHLGRRSTERIHHSHPADTLSQPTSPSDNFLNFQQPSTCVFGERMSCSLFALRRNRPKRICDEQVSGPNLY
jgi:hypothetical protein